MKIKINVFFIFISNPPPAPPLSFFGASPGRRASQFGDRCCRRRVDTTENALNCRPRLGSLGPGYNMYAITFTGENLNCSRLIWPQGTTWHICEIQFPVRNTWKWPHPFVHVIEWGSEILLSAITMKFIMVIAHNKPTKKVNDKYLEFSC